MKTLKKEFQQIFRVVLVLFIVGLLFDKFAYKLKLKEEKTKYIEATQATSEIRHEVSLRVEKLEKVAIQNSRIFGYGQSFIKDIYDVENLDVDKEIDSIPDNWWSLRLENVKENHGVKGYDLRFTDMIWPVDMEDSYVAFRLCEFGYRRSWTDREGNKHYYTHTGLDVANGMNKKLVAMSDGKIKEKGFDKYGGNYIIIETDKHFIKYYHMNRIDVEKDQEVHKGDRVGIMGNTGLWSQGEHLHLEIKDKRTGKYINPVINSTWGFPVVEML